MGHTSRTKHSPNTFSRRRSPLFLTGLIRLVFLQQLVHSGKLGFNWLFDVLKKGWKRRDRPRRVGEQQQETYFSSRAQNIYVILR